MAKAIIRQSGLTPAPGGEGFVCVGEITSQDSSTCGVGYRGQFSIAELLASCFSIQVAYCKQGIIFYLLTTVTYVMFHYRKHAKQ